LDIGIVNKEIIDVERDIIDLVRFEGPLTGLEIKKAIDMDNLLVWKACKASRKLQVRTPGRRYLRLDRRVDGFARFSPSILREFFTYSVVGLTSDPELLDKRCTEVISRIYGISRFKFELARRMVSDIMKEFGDRASEGHQICFIIAGDIVYNMAHDVPRPERSTGKLVRGSDIDLVAVVDDKLSDADINRLDGLIYQKKYRMLIDPSVNEEVDYRIKRLGLVREQARFDNFKRMVAGKIIQEGVLLYGSENLYRTIKTIIQENGVLEKLDELKRVAKIFREKAEESILLNDLDKTTVEEMHLFYSAEEFEEFE
jgi:energy-coupling factor transporter ATP-binding protein EcfA2